jgi:hypothetical protein
VKRIIALLLFTCLLVSGITASNDPIKTRMVSGKIIDKQTGETLTGVKIQVKGTNTFCYSDMEGAFSFTTPITAEVVIDMVGYEQTTLKTNQLSISSDIVLSPL